MTQLISIPTILPDRLVPTSAAKLSPSDHCAAMVFKVAGYVLALPYSAIIRVDTRANLNTSISPSETLVFINNVLVHMLELSRLLTAQLPNPRKQAGQSVATPDRSHPFVVLAQGQSGNVYAIPVEKPPTLQTLSLSEVCIIPSSYQMTIGYIASHLIVLSLQGQSTSVFLLDLDTSHRQLLTT